MCGINGFIHKKSLDSNTSVSEINAMNELIFHRGPDEDGVFNENTKAFSIAMGMRRLSIIDLNSGKQPIYSEDKTIVIVFNGEIYNYRELKSKLLAKGVTFLTTSDTEVILKLYELYGVESFKQLDGMFAFSIYDKNLNKVFIARDFFGEKPLYYTNTNKEFVWGSELKSVVNKITKRPPINKKGLNLFFRLTYVPAPYTIYEDIFKLEANSYITYDIETFKFSIHTIEKEHAKAIDKDISFDEAKKKVKELVNNSVISRSVSDVPLGTFLSGGVDSSIVSLCLSQYSTNPIDTFSIGFEKKSFDETDKSREVAKMIGSKHHEFVIGEKDLQQNVDEILLNFDEPFADSSSLPTYLVANKTRDYVKVALTGDGGDEMFGGYNKYYMGKMNDNYSKIIPRKAHGLLKNIVSPFLKVSSDNRGTRYQIKKALDSIDYDGDYYWDIISLGYPNDSLNTYLKPSYTVNNIFNWYKNKTGIINPANLSEYRLIDKHISLEGDMLVKVDRTSMLNSLECRAPFLNKEIWNYANTIPEKFLLNGWNKKYILKQAFQDQFPKDFLEKGKSGFGVPVGDWLRSSLQEELNTYINVKVLDEQQIFNTEPTIQLVKNHLSGREDNTFKVWTFYCFQKWYFNTYKKLSNE